MTTSPMRPMAWASLPIIEIAPMSCKQILGGDGRRPDAAFGEREILGHRRVEVMADHQHVEVLVERVDGVRPRRVGGTRQHVGMGGDRDDVGRVPAAGALGVIRVDRPPFDGGEGVLDEAHLVEGVGVDVHLDAGLVGDGEARVDCRGRRTPSPHAA